MQRLDPADVTARLRRQWQRRRGDWLDADARDDPQGWPLAIPLHPPNERELGRLFQVLGALSSGSCRGLYLRQLPIAGIDSKWVGANRARVTELLRPLLCWAGDGDGDGAGDLWTIAGLRREPKPLRLRLLDPRLRARVGGLADVSAPVEQVAALPLAPARVYVVENLQTGLAFTDRQSAAVILGLGYAVELLGRIPWLQGADCRYWGDLDTHGFAILDRLRACLPHARSLLMDEATLLEHRQLWSREDKPALNLRLSRLDDTERAVYDGLAGDRWGPAVRLEQERIGWDYAWERIITG